MEWVLQSPQIHSTFGNLGYVQADGYHVNENCNAALEIILHNILTEDKFLRTYRRSISFGQNIKKDLIPLLIHAKDEKTIELLIRVLVNLTIPIECLLSMDIISKTDFGRHTIFEINNLLASTKAAFTDHRTTRVIIDFLKKNLGIDQKTRLSLEKRTNISNSLLLLRNILHIPEENSGQRLTSCNGRTVHAIQNQILWNIFSHGIDKTLIKLMIIPDATNWGVTMVQLIALLYKDQHVATLHKLLNSWFEGSLTDSSEDNESNTSPRNRGSEDSSPMLTTDSTSDSSDTGGSGKSNDGSNGNTGNNYWNGSIHSGGAEKTSELDDKNEYIEDSSKPTYSTDKEKFLINKNQQTGETNTGMSTKNEKKTVISENSDCGYGTQIDNQESISTSSNEDELPVKKPVHQKPHNQKQRIQNKTRSVNINQDRKRKKNIKGGKLSGIIIQGLLHKTPNDDDISSVLKEFTVDFLLKGYNSLVQTLHNQILTNLQLEIDTSHFFWLVTYFLKFATQIELDLEYVCSVLSFDIISYLIAEGVHLCEHFEISIKFGGSDLKPSIRRLHLVVTAIREFVQAIEAYKKFTHLCQDDKDALIRLQIKMCETEELRNLLVLLLRNYNPKYHSKQYLQDLIVTNHILLAFIDNVLKSPECNGTVNMPDHIKQFATTEVMYQYGLLLEDYTVNGEFVNDCIFTLMHHVGGELESLITLFQPKILKIFTSIWKSEFEICDDWSDLIEYVINTFVKKPHTLQTTTNFRLDTKNFDDDILFIKPTCIATGASKQDKKGTSTSSKDRWSEDEISSLSWNYIQCNSMPDVIGELMKLFKEDGIIKTRDSVIKELFKQNLIDQEEFEKLVKSENYKIFKAPVDDEMKDDEITKLCNQLTQDGKLKFLDWIQKVLLDVCYAKICIERRSNICNENIIGLKAFKMQNIHNNYPIISPVSYHSLAYGQSVPLVPWNCEQAATCKDLKFLQLLHNLGLHMPVDSGKVFIRIPHFWTAEILYEIAGKILPIDTRQLKFSINDIADSAVTRVSLQNTLILPKDLTRDVPMIDAQEKFYQVHKQQHFGTMVNFTPMPGSSFASEGAVEPSKTNWFDLVQKSQEYKITLNLERTDDDKEMKPVWTPPVVTPEWTAPAPEATSSAPPVAPAHAPVPPALPVSNIKQHAAFSATHVEAEFFNNSVCETASVASDLTRMYVSDEDEKPEVLTIPENHFIPVLEDIPRDIDVTTTVKRPRLQFS